MTMNTIVDSSVSYERMGHYTKDQLNTLLVDAYNNNMNYFPSQNPNLDAKIDPTKYGATNGVTLYKVFYNTKVPETGAIEKVSGLVAIPDGIGTSAPLVSYQHGTVLDRVTVPSNVIKTDAAGAIQWGDASTLVNVVRFAGNGYILSAADYLGKGISSTQEAYAVKGATNQTNLDMLQATDKILNNLNIAPDKLFLTGQSQGGLNTQWLTQALESMSVPITASAAMTPFNDLVASFQAWTSVDRLNPNNGHDPVPWLPPTIAIALSSYQKYYNINGLVDAAIKPEYLAQIKQYLANDNYYDWAKATNANWPITTGGSVAGITAKEMLVSGFSNSYTSPQVAQFYQQLKDNSAFNWNYTTPITFYYGTADEVLPVNVVTKPLVLGGPLVSSQAALNATHMGTFLYSLFANNSSATNPITSYDWFNNLKATASQTPHLALSSDQIIVSGDSYDVLKVSLKAIKSDSSGANIVDVYRVTGDPLNGGAKEYLGSIGSVKGGNQSLGAMDALLQTGDRLLFESHDATGAVIPASASINPTSVGYQIDVRSGNNANASVLTIDIAESKGPISLSQQVAATQNAPSSDFLNIRAGDAINIHYQNAQGFANVLGLVKLDQDAVTHLPTGAVGGVLPNSPFFADMVKSHLVSNLPAPVQNSNGTGDIYWVAPSEGVYAVVATDSTGLIYTYGPRSYSDGKAHVLNIGDNAFAFETAYGSTFDGGFNDFFVQVSPEVNINKFIYGLYNTAFNRDADNVGLKFWIDTSHQGQLTPTVIVDNFMRSGEYINIYGSAVSNSDFVTRLYQNTFGRLPEPAGLAYWVDQLNAGLEKDKVIVSIVESTEAMQLIGTQHPDQPWMIQ